MNILIVSMSHAFGGAEAYLLNLEKILLSKHKVYIITSSPMKQFGNILTFLPIFTFSPTLQNGPI